MRKLLITIIGAGALLGLSGACEDDEAMDNTQPVLVDEQELRVDQEATPGERAEELDEATAAAPDLAALHPESSAGDRKPAERRDYDRMAEQEPDIPAEGAIGSSPDPDPRPTLEGAAYLPAVED